MSNTEITYLSWNRYIVGSFTLIIFGLVVTIFYVRLVVLNEVYREFRVCDPVFFYYGNKSSCNILIEKTVQNSINDFYNKYYSFDKRISKKNIEEIINTETFENPNLAKLIIEESNSLDFLNFDVKETIKNNYLAMVEFIHSLKELFWVSTFITIKQMATI